MSQIQRFTPAERWVHRSTAILVGILVVTGAILYFGTLSVAVGRRTLVEGIHVGAGLALPFPTLLGLLSREFRADVERLSRFLPDDREWLRRKDRRMAQLRVGKFNAGQKLAASFVAGAGLTLLASGLLMLGPTVWNVPLQWRQGATLVHDALAFALFVVLVGHAVMAYRHPEARRALRTGVMDAAYADREYAAWSADPRQ